MELYRPGAAVTELVPTWSYTVQKTLNRPGVNQFPNQYCTGLIQYRPSVKYTKLVPSSTYLPVWFQNGPAQVLTHPIDIYKQIEVAPVQLYLYTALLVHCIMPRFYPCETCKAGALSAWAQAHLMGRKHCCWIPRSLQGIRLVPRWTRCCSTLTMHGNPLRSWFACFPSDHLHYVNQQQTGAPGPSSLKDQHMFGSGPRLLAVEVLRFRHPA
ncbi:UNVERIFIED_CONTAM: hypothetical protein FKN15_051929 [Acipenser sinensis]